MKKHVRYKKAKPKNTVVVQLRGFEEYDNYINNRIFLGRVRLDKEDYKNYIKDKNSFVLTNLSEDRFYFVPKMPVIYGR